MKVGQLASRAGLTVRTLHHYDEIGLLEPTSRTPAGHRLYGLSELKRLQQIASLRQLGLSLEEIRDCLTRPHYSLDRVLELQIARLEDEIGRYRRLKHLIRHLRDRLRTTEGVSVAELTRTIGVTMNLEKYYTPEQLDALAQRRESVGADRMEAVQGEWQELFDAFGKAMQAGLDPASEKVRKLARKSGALIEEFTGGDPAIRSSLGAMYRSEGADQVMEGHGMQMAEGLWEYMGRASAALEGEG